ncbi:FecR domain-containing protein [Catenovulum sp. 2E275]|uniref:FecR family protein n=1 Tax=Catenovulum sp. 2E275 TaxID=2980497 RepID=UPI0021D1FFD9|nr:FecR domain-containing protein [Catenovulum sp. 2E275]MCU4677258.1 FecR domain-containing protein [Catenovulum sp. 2E275]
MSNIYPFPNQADKAQITNDDSLDQACLWISRIDRELNQVEKGELKHWLEQNPQHLTDLLEVANLWDKMDELSRLSDLFPKTKQTAPKTHFGLYAAASLFLLVLSAWFILDYSNNHTQPEQNILATQTNYQTKVGQNQVIKLPDGSELTLNTNTFVQVKFSENRRIIDLHRGEIHIQVAHDPTRPLDVLAAGQKIQAVGTAFSVQMKKDIVELLVTDGKVKVEQTQQKTASSTQTIQSEPVQFVAKGEKLDLDLTGKTAKEIEKVEDADIAAKLSWRSGNLVFRGETLAQAMAEIERYTETKITLEQNDTLKNIKVAGVFKTGDIKGLLIVLSQNFNIEHQTLADGTIKLSLANS